MTAPGALLAVLSTPHMQRCTDALVLVQETPRDSHSGDVPVVHHPVRSRPLTDPHERRCTDLTERLPRPSSFEPRTRRCTVLAPVHPYCLGLAPHTQRCTTTGRLIVIEAHVHSAHAEIHR